MKRRHFLSMFGASVAAPLIPLPSTAAVLNAPATASRGAAYGLAVFHARTRYALSVSELATRARVSTSEAAQMVQRLLSDQHIIAGKIPGTYTAANPYLQNPALRELARKSHAKFRARKSAPMSHAQPDLSAFLAHLRGVADRYFQGQIA